MDTTFSSSSAKVDACVRVVFRDASCHLFNATGNKRVLPFSLVSFLFPRGLLLARLWVRGVRHAGFHGQTKANDLAHCHILFLRALMIVLAGLRRSFLVMWTRPRHQMSGSFSPKAFPSADFSSLFPRVAAVFCLNQCPAALIAAPSSPDESGWRAPIITWAAYMAILFRKKWTAPGMKSSLRTCRGPSPWYVRVARASWLPMNGARIGSNLQRPTSSRGRHRGPAPPRQAAWNGNREIFHFEIMKAIPKNGRRFPYSATSNKPRNFHFPLKAVNRAARFGWRMRFIYQRRKNAGRE